MSSNQTGPLGAAEPSLLTHHAEHGQTKGQASESESVSLHSELPFDVFRKLVESPDDFLGLLAYSLYKRHKIEWIGTHPYDEHETFKKVACTPQQLGMYRYQAEQMAKGFIDVSLDQLEAEMRSSILEGEVIIKIQDLDKALHAKVATLEKTVTTKADALKWKFWPALGNHMLSGLASVIVALLIFGCFSLYNLYQQQGGLEGMAKQASILWDQQLPDSPAPLPQFPQG
ncbi:hypothetical protein IAE37_004614 [Pseudomonas sp. S31]|uniref:hypothetical protein n=1 Tax=Pseudomonas sp. S31 TaxID=1564473 RepID=UPI00191305E8|nr:hypothetical protein [Pseudomonas sp. S31]MBK5002338.1 hypothetical protein [Pseudomonas sp. S31]